MTTTTRKGDYLQSILNAFNDLIFILDSEGIIRDYLKERNSEWLYLPKEQFIGKNHKDVLPPHVSLRIEEALAAMVAGEKRFSFDYHLLIDGRQTWFSAVFSPLQDSNGTTEKYLCVIREITARKENELLIKGLLENAFNGIIVLRSIRNHMGTIEDFEWVIVNHEAEKLIGKTAEALQHKRIKDETMMTFEECVRIVETGIEIDKDHDLIRNQTKLWLHIHAAKHEDGVVITLINITSNKIANQELEAALHQLRQYSNQMDLFFTQSLTGFFFMNLDEPIEWDETSDKEAALDYAISHLRFSRINDALVRQYGTTHEQLYKLTVKDFFTKDPEKGKSILRELYDKKHIHVNRVSRKMDGTELWLEGDYICFTDGNKITGHFGTQRDVTERKLAEETLRASEERYRLLSENMLDLVALHDIDGTYKYLSPSVTRMLGYSPDELINTSPYKLFHPDDITRIEKQSHIKAKQGEEVAHIEYRIRKKDGTYIWFSTNTNPIKDTNGKVIMLQTVSRDVTERVMTLQLLEELNNQKTKLFSIIAHDLRGPVANCLGLLQLLQLKPEGENIEKHLKLLHQSGLKLYDLMEDLLMWASNQLEKTAYHPTVRILADEISAVTRIFNEMARQKHITVTSFVIDESITVYADKDMVRTILRNLLTNAIKFTKPGGHIAITASASDTFVSVSVIDNGIGIRKEDQDKLFGKTSTFTTYGTGGEKGTGLGLDICKDYVERHKGRIWVESEPGQGSKFTFTLPVHQGVLI